MRYSDTCTFFVNFIIINQLYPKFGGCSCVFIFSWLIRNFIFAYSELFFDLITSFDLNVNLTKNQISFGQHIYVLFISICQPLCTRRLFDCTCTFVISIGAFKSNYVQRSGSAMFAGPFYLQLKYRESIAACVFAYRTLLRKILFAPG